MSDPSNPDDFTPAERDDLLAAEYVLGVLAADERRAAQRRAEVEGGFAARIHAWEVRFSVLNTADDESPAPDLLPAIEARLFGVPTRRPARWRLWLGAGALAASVALAVMIWPQAPTPMVAHLQADAVVFDARFDALTGVLEIRHQGAAAQTGHDYQLWVIGADGVPHSLGLVRAPVSRIAATLQQGQTLAVSLEPLGGAAGALPTGPVLASAVLALN